MKKLRNNLESSTNMVLTWICILGLSLTEGWMMVWFSVCAIMFFLFSFIQADWEE